MTLEEVKQAWKEPMRICRASNHRPYNYQPVYFIVENDVLMVVDQDKQVFSDIPNSKQVAAFQQSEHNDWILF